MFFVLRYHSQRFIIFFALALVLFCNTAFFKELFSFTFEEHNYFIALSAPFVLWLMFIALLNLLLLFIPKTLFKLILIAIMATALLSGYFINTFHTVIDVNMYINVSQTDSAEILDLITPKLLLYIGVMVACSLWLFFKAPLHFHTYKAEVLQKALIALVSIAMLTGFYMSFSKSYSAFFRNHHELKYYLNPTYPIASFVKYVQQNLKPKPALQAIALDASRQTSERKKLVVFILGETARAQNFSLAGYNVKTNPLLEQQSSLVFLDNVASCGTATAISVPCMFSKFNRLEWNTDKEMYENVVDILSKTGVRIIWRDNNSGGDKKVAARMKNVVQFGGKEFDNVLLKDFQSNIDEKYEDTFIVLHQEGSHGPTYFKRYPDAFKQFTPTCDTQELDKCSHEQIVNTYNNTILYTDYIINETIKLLKANEDKYDITLMYMSDHGESLGENGIYLHGLPYMIAPVDQKHIPALVYFGKHQTQNYAKLRLKSKERFAHDNLFHTLLGLFEVKTSEYKPELDLLR